MATKESKSNASGRPSYDKRDTAPDDFPTELDGEFANLPAQTVQNIGVIAGLAVTSGGYFGLSCTDDGGSVRLAIRHGSFALDKRFYAATKFEAALAYCLRKLREAM